MGSGWCSHTLKALAEYRSRRCCSSLPLFASVAGKGRLVGLGGGGALVGHEQVLGGVAPPCGLLTLGMWSWGSVVLLGCSADLEGGFRVDPHFPKEAWACL